MPFEELKPEATASGTGGSINVMVSSKGKVSCRLTVTEAAQQEHFGRSLIGERVSFAIGRGVDEGVLLVRLDTEGPFQFVSSMKGSVRVNLPGWSLIGKSKRPAAPVKFKPAPDGVAGAIVKLPDWASPKKADLAREFSLKGGVKSI